MASCTYGRNSRLDREYSTVADVWRKLSWKPIPEAVNAFLQPLSHLRSQRLQLAVRKSQEMIVRERKRGFVVAKAIANTSSLNSFAGEDENMEILLPFERSEQVTIPPTKSNYTGKSLPDSTRKDSRETKRIKPNKNAVEKLVERCEDLRKKLKVLKGALMQLGGVRDVLKDIENLQNALAFATLIKRFVEGQRGYVSNSLEPATTHLEELSEQAEAMQQNFDQLGAVSGCHFLALCDILAKISTEAWQDVKEVKRFRYSQGKARTLARKHISLYPGLRDLSDALDTFSDEIMSTIDRDIPILRAAQGTLPKYYLNMTTIAAFFSGITASVLQISVPKTDTTLQNAVNATWFISLVFSIVCVVVSLVGMLWNHSDIPMRQRDSTLKKNAISLLHKGPAISMTASAIAFMVGLALFVNASEQAKTTSKIVTIVILLVSATVFVLLAIYFAMRYGVGLRSPLAKASSFLRRTLLYGRETIISRPRRLFTKYQHIPDPEAHIMPQDSISVSQLPHSRDPRKSDTKHNTDADMDKIVIARTLVCLRDFHGPLAVAKYENNSQCSTLTIYKDYQDISPTKCSIETLSGEVKELIWSPNGQSLLIIKNNGLRIWKKEVSEADEEKTSIQCATWTDDSRILAIEPNLESLIYYDCQADQRNKDIVPLRWLSSPWRGKRVFAAHEIDGVGYLLCITDGEDNGKQSLLLTNHDLRQIVHSEAFEGSVKSMQVRTVPVSRVSSDSKDQVTKIVLGFEDLSSPLLCYLKHPTRAHPWEMALAKFKYENTPAIGPSENCKYLSPVSFAGRMNELVLCAVSSGGSLPDRLLVWSTDEAVLIRTIDLSSLYSDFLPTCVTWTVDEAWTLALVAAYDDGKVVKAKDISFFESFNEDQYLTILEFVEAE